MTILNFDDAISKSNSLLSSAELKSLVLNDFLVNVGEREEMLAIMQRKTICFIVMLW